MFKELRVHRLIEYRDNLAVVGFVAISLVLIAQALGYKPWTTTLAGLVFGAYGFSLWLTGRSVGRHIAIQFFSWLLRGGAAGYSLWMAATLVSAVEWAKYLAILVAMTSWVGDGLTIYSKRRNLDWHTGPK